MADLGWGWFSAFAEEQRRPPGVGQGKNRGYTKPRLKKRRRR